MSLRTSQGRLTWVGREPPLQRCWTAVRKCTEKGDGLGRPSVCVCVCVCVCVLVTQSCQTRCRPMYCGLPVSSARGILQARILGWVATPFSRGIFLTQGKNPGLLH